MRDSCGRKRKDRMSKEWNVDATSVSEVAECLMDVYGVDEEEAARLVGLHSHIVLDGISMKSHVEYVAEKIADEEGLVPVEEEEEEEEE